MMQEEFDKKTLHDKIREVTQFPLLDIGVFFLTFSLFSWKEITKKFSFVELLM